MKKIKSIFVLMLTMMKIGAFTFGGGYAMISLLHSEFVFLRCWVLQLDIWYNYGWIPVVESTLIHYKKEIS